MPDFEVDGELDIETSDGPIRCVGTGSSFEIIFENLWQMVRVGRPVRVPLTASAFASLLSIAHAAGIKVTMRIGKRTVGEISSQNGHDRPRVKLRFLDLAAAAVIRGNSK
jgi:sugar/nucleoside kinase (ribokinase family)